MQRSYRFYLKLALRGVLLVSMLLQLFQSAANVRAASPSVAPDAVPPQPPVNIYPVTSTNDSGYGSLSQAITAPNIPPSVSSSATPTTVCAISFIDVSIDNTFYANIRCLACKGIMGGYSDGTFRPNNNITRSQIAKIVSNAAGFNESPGAQIYEDAPPSYTFFAWINRLSRRGHMGGYPCGGTAEPCGPGNRPYFRPNASATRGQLAKIVASAAGIMTTPTGQRYADVPPNSIFYVWIEQLSALGVMGGYACGAAPNEPCDAQNRPYFRPNNNVTRGQASKIVANTFFPRCETYELCGPSGGELLGDSNPTQGSNTGLGGVNVNTATGNFWYTATDFFIPGRGPSLLLNHTYNALAAGTPGPLGHGWTHSYNMFVNGSTNPVVHQENGSTAPFLGVGPTYTHDPRVLAELVRNGDGTFTLTRTQGLDRFTFNAQGKLTEIRDRNNYATTLGYDGNSRLVTVTETAGRQVLFTYNGDGQIIQAHDGAGNRDVFYDYDSSGNLITFTDVGGKATRFTYDTNHRVLTITDPNGGMISNTYDAAGRVVSQHAPVDRVYGFAYVNNFDRTVTTITDPLDINKVHTHSCNRLVESVYDAFGPQRAVWLFTYGPGYVSGRSSITDPNNHTWRKTWDAKGNLLTSSDPLGHTNTNFYNATNDLVGMRDPMNRSASINHNEGGDIVAIVQPISSQEEVVTGFVYDPQHPGDITAIFDPNHNASRITYDTYGYVISMTNPLNETTFYTHDAIGNRLSVTSPRGYTANKTYNAYGDTLTSTDFRGNVTTTTYDDNRNVLSVRDPNNQVTSNTYNLANWRTRVTQPDGTHNDTVYDLLGKVLIQTNGLGQSTTYGYDHLNRLISSRDALARTTSYTRDLAGLLVEMRDPQGRVTTYGYNAANELVTINYSDGTTPNVTFTYDQAGYRISMTDGSGLTTYGHDSLGRMITAQQGTQVVRYFYDWASNLYRITYPGLGEINRTYNAANRMTSLRDPFGNTTQFQYNPDGNLTAKLLPNGTRADMDYNADGQVMAITHSLNGTPFLALTYGRDEEGMLTTATEPGAGTNSYAYDALDRLTGDALVGGQPVIRTWGYDGAYEITNTTIVSSGPPVETTRNYNAANELLRLTELTGGVPTRDRAFTYNLTGDRIEQTGLGGPNISYGYDQESRLTSYAADGTTTSYGYDGDGLRRSKTQGTSTEAYTWDLAAKLPMLLADRTARYLYGPDGKPLAEVMIGTNAIYYYHADQLGSIRAMTDQAGAVVNTSIYDPYGVPLSNVGSVSNPFGYAGEYEDAESGLIYLRARYYDPTTQQFLTVDPLVKKGEQAYAYVDDNPLNHTDPSGLSWRSWWQKNSKVVGKVLKVIGLLAMAVAVVAVIASTGGVATWVAWAFWGGLATVLVGQTLDPAPLSELFRW
jgi:RHS repeat-associated protein